MSDEPVTRPHGITVSRGGVVPAAQATRGRAAVRVSGDSVIGAAVDRRGVLDTFGLTSSARIDVPTALGPTSMLVQDLTTGRWYWQLGAATGRVRRFDLEVPDESGRDASSRPAGSGALLLVKVVGVVGIDSALGARREFAVVGWEKFHRPSGIVWFRRRDGLGRPPPVQSAELEGRSLLLLHDLFGTTLSSFADLPGPARHRLEERYDQRVWGFDHPTLATDPATNASRLIELLGPSSPPMTVDILAVGRGGLVAVALAARSEELPFTLGSIGLIGTPLRGSPTYESERHVALVNRYTNLLSLTPDDPFTTTFDAVIALVSQLATGATSGLTGLAACAHGVPGPLPEGPTWRLTAAHTAVPPIGAERLRDDVLDRDLAEPHDLFVSVASATPQDAFGDSGDALGEVVPWTEDGDAAAPGANDTNHRTLVRTAPVERLLGAPAPSPVAPASAAPRGKAGALAVAADRGSPATPSPGDLRRFRRRDEAARAPGAIPPLEVDVVHGAIEVCGDTVLVGHYRGMEITGAEAALDVRVRGRLGTRQLARLYPEEIGQSCHLVNSRASGGTGGPSNVVVVGLGDPGELSRTLITRSVTAGLLRYAFDRVEAEARRSTEVVELSSVMIGLSGPAPVTVADSVAGVVEGVIGANARLRELPDSNGRRLSERLRFGRLSFVQLHADLADIGARAVARLDDYLTGVAAGVTATGSPRLGAGGDGGWPARLESDDDPGWYRVVIECPEPQPDRRPSLKFTALGRRAQADQLTVSPSPAVVKQLTARAITDHDQAAAATLFDLLVPADLRSAIAVAGNLQFVVDGDAATHPWEALIPGHGTEGEGALARRAAFIRQFTNTEGSRGRVRTGDSRVAVVVGNPPTHLGPLPAAFGETAKVIDLLERSGFAVTPSRWPPTGPDWDPPQDHSGEIAVALTTPHCRVLHIAAHGQMSDNPDASGVVIGPDSFLTAGDIAQRSEVPELVFLNCCELADHVGLASSLAHAFMQAGAQAVVAAGWAVNDAAADHFATRFYRSMLSGATFGAAVREARAEAYRALPGGMTWAAYQCYGDPGFRLEPKRAASITFPQMVSPTELLRQIEVIGVRAGSIGRVGGVATELHRRRLLAELTTLAGLVAEDVGTKGWLDARAHAALAKAAAELGDLEQAVAWYREALNAEKAASPMRTLEALGNLEIRLAQKLRRRGGPSAEVDELVRSATDHLDLALRAGETSERRSLLGSLYKKQATLETGEARSELISKAAEEYGKAMKIRPESAYPVGNWLQLSVIAGTSPTRARAKKALEGTEASSINLDGGFWGRAALGDNLLTRMLLGIRDAPELLGTEGASDKRRPVERTVDAYRDAFSVRSAWSQRASVLDHLRDLIELTEDQPRLAKKHDELVDVLEGLLEWVRAELEQDQ